MDGWDGLDGMEVNGTGWHGTGWDGLDGMGLDGTGWDEMDWDGCLSV